jgi:hypothetical protein
MQTMDSVERNCSNIFRVTYPDLDIEMPDRLELLLGAEMLHRGG